MIEVLFILQNFSIIIGRQKYIFFGLLLMHRVIGYTSFHSVFTRHFIPCSNVIAFRIQTSLHSVFGPRARYVHIHYNPGLAIAHPGLT